MKCAYDSKKGTCVRLPSSSSSSDKSGFDVCSSDSPPANHSEDCAAIKSCTSCVSTTFDCVWCDGDGGSGCRWRGCGDSGAKVRQRQEDEKAESDIATSPRQDGEEYTVCFDEVKFVSLILFADLAF